MSERDTTPQRRAKGKLTRALVLEAAVALADGAGVEGLTMRRLATRLGVQPMSIYHHVADKESILDGIVDAVFAAIDGPGPTDGVDGDWRGPMHGVPL